MSRRICSTCMHYGCCDDYCGGRYWHDAHVKCEECGESFVASECYYHDGEGHFFCTEDCAVSWEKKHKGGEDGK